MIGFIWFIIILYSVAIGFITLNMIWYRRRYNFTGENHDESVVVIVPCKDSYEGMAQKLNTLLTQSYSNYQVIFVTGNPNDSANSVIKEAIADYPEKASLIINDSAPQHRSQKVHNQLFALQKIKLGSCDILVFADSDASYPQDWLVHLIAPLHNSDVGATTGVFWLDEAQGAWAQTLAWAYNIQLVPTFANPRLSYAWGGGMAVYEKYFYELGIDKIWQNAVYDDLPFALAVNADGKKIHFVPEIVNSPLRRTTWKECVDWIRRQLLATRLYIPYYHLLVLALLAVPFLVILSPLLALLNSAWLWLLLLIPIRVVFGILLCWDLKRPETIPYAIWDYLSLVMVAVGAIKSLFGNRITWAGITYELISPTETHVIPKT